MPGIQESEVKPDKKCFPKKWKITMHAFYNSLFADGYTDSSDNWKHHREIPQTKRLKKLSSCGSRLEEERFQGVVLGGQRKETAWLNPCRNQSTLTLRASPSWVRVFFLSHKTSFARVCLHSLKNFSLNRSLAYLIYLFLRRNSFLQTRF